MQPIADLRIKYEIENVDYHNNISYDINETALLGDGFYQTKSSILNGDEIYSIYTNGIYKLIFQTNANGKYSYPELDWGLVGIANMQGTILEGAVPCGVKI